MSAIAKRNHRLEAAFIGDEIGIVSGGYGIYRLRCLYQPIFERHGRTLQAVAVEGVAAPYVAGEEVPRDVFLAASADDDLDFIEHMELALPLRNHGNVGFETAELVVGIAGESDPRAIFDRVRFVADQLAATEVDPRLVICAVSEPTAADDATLVRLAEDIRSRDMRVAIGDFGVTRWTDSQLEALRPETVRIDGEWFRKVCRDAVTVRLFDSVVARLHERRSKVLVSGIESDLQFGVALRSGADLFQGAHLTPPALVGTIVDETVPLRAKLGNADKIVPLYG
jgi:EAL domain-containing protein (putative c-di-GMP-specific phosphodiesterase class I)